MDARTEGRAATGVEREGLMAEVDVVVLDLRRPVRSKGVLDAGAEQPSDAGIVLSRRAGRNGAGDSEVHAVFGLGPGGAALHVEQRTIVDHAEPAGGGRDPVVAGVAAADDQARRAAFQIGPVEIALDADEPQLANCQLSPIKPPARNPFCSV